MLHFFRKMRNALIPESRFGRYFFYALGEIVLVVIGILIALQVNNWNEERKNRKLEIEYLERIKIEMQKNLGLAKIQITYSNFQIENIERIFITLSNGTSHSTPEQLLVAIEHVGWDVPVRSIDNVWNELINSGKAGLIQNNLLNEKLGSYHSNMQFLIEVHKEWLSYNLGYRRLVGDVINPQTRGNIALHLTPTKYTGSLTNLPNQQIIKNKLKELNGLNGYLADIRMVTETNIHSFEKIQETINQIINICDDELKK